MRNAGLRGCGGVQREKAEMSRTGAEEAVWIWDRPCRLGVRTESRGEEIANTVASDNQRRSWDMWIKENPHRGSRQVRGE